MLLNNIGIHDLQDEKYRLIKLQCKSFKKDMSLFINNIILHIVSLHSFE